MSTSVENFAFESSRRNSTNRTSEDSATVIVSSPCATSHETTQSGRRSSICVASSLRASDMGRYLAMVPVRRIFRWSWRMP
jgi:hypothetical protein